MDKLDVYTFALITMSPIFGFIIGWIVGRRGTRDESIFPQPNRCGLIEAIGLYRQSQMASDTKQIADTSGKSLQVLSAIHKTLSEKGATGDIPASPNKI